MRKIILLVLLVSVPLFAQKKQSVKVSALSHELSANGHVVRQKVLTDTGVTYTIMCSMTFRWDKCSYLMDGERYSMEIDKKTAWINGLKNGNQGKATRIKYDIVDIR